VSCAQVGPAPSAAAAGPGLPQPGVTGGAKYKANVGKTNSKYISPYSLRQLAGQNASQQG
jgi:hypothetical protein